MKERLESQLPRGYTIVVPPSLKERFVRFLTIPRYDSSPEKYSLIRQGLQDKASAAFYLMTHEALVESRPDLEEYLGEINVETGLANRILLARGFQGIKEGNLVITHNYVVDMPNGHQNDFVYGGSVPFIKEYGFPLKRSWRKVEGDIIGIVFNLPRLPLFKSIKEIVDSKEISEATLSSFITAYTEFLRAEKEGNLSIYFTQDEFDKTMNWAIFGNQQVNFTS